MPHAPGLVARCGAQLVPTVAGSATAEVGPLTAAAAGDVDVAALLKGYAEQGVSVLPAGPHQDARARPFVVVIADAEQGSLTLARSVSGPAVHYTVGDGVARVAANPSELGVPLVPDTAAVQRFVGTGGAGDDLLTGVRQVRGGEVVRLAPEPQIVVAAPDDHPVGPPAAPAELVDVAALADALTRDLWQLLHEQGAPPDTPGRYVAWAAGNTDQRPPLVPTSALLLRLKNRVYGSFLSDTFAARPWWRANDEIAGFEEFIRSNGTAGNADRFWRLYLIEQWARVVLEDEPAPEVTPPKGPFDPNRDKRVEIEVAGRTWLRFPVRTNLFAKGDDLGALITGYVGELVAAARQEGRDVFTRPWYLVVSEKIVAIAQGRSFFIWEIRPNWWARTLSRYVVRTPYGIGLGSPWTMQLALQEVGLPRILLASAVSLIGKAIGRRGWFYRVAGPAVRAIDGPTEYSAYPANVSAKLAPAEPAKVCERLGAALRTGLPEPAGATLRGVVVIDANDIGRNVMGQLSDRPDAFFEEVFADNPLGQGDERTPLCVVVPGQPVAPR